MWRRPWRSSNRHPSIEVVLLDINLPRMGGMALLSELQKRDEAPGVIIATAISDQQIAKMAHSLGAFDYLVKPLDMDRLEAVISACISYREYHRRDGFWRRLVAGL